MRTQEPTRKEKLRFWAIVLAVLLVPICYVAYGFLTETTSGKVRRVEDLSRVYAGASRSFHDYPQQSAISRFPFTGDIRWTRFQIRPQVHLTGQVDLNRLDAFLSSSPIGAHSWSDTTITFDLTEPRVYTQGEIDRATSTAKLYSFDREAAED